MNSKNNKLFLLCSLVFATALTRLMPHPWNFTPVTALFIFTGAISGKKFTNFLIPLSAVLLSDFLLNNFIYRTANFTFFYEGALYVYSAYLLIFLLNLYLKVDSKLSIIGTSFISSIIFFLITNFAAWYVNPLYNRDFSGLMTSYVVGLPFFGNAILGDLFYSLILFSAYNMIYQSLLKKSSVHDSH
jgi:hypothetical protein